MKTQIKNRFSGIVIGEGDCLVKELSEKNRADLRGADLRGAKLYGADLSGADLRGADLRGAKLYGADLSGADLSGAKLYEADLYEADLSGADLSGADLYKANLYKADLEFPWFPSIRLLSSISFIGLSNGLTLELMRRDACAHPNPKKFDEWAKGGICPYQNEERFWLFREKRELWKKGKPKMRDDELILELCKSQGWKIRGYLK